MNFANTGLCQRLYELTGKPAHWTWDCTGDEPQWVGSNGDYGHERWPAYTLGELYRLNPRATTWFKKETPRLGGMCSARTDSLPNFIAHANTPEDTAAMLQIEFEHLRLRQRQFASRSTTNPKQSEVI